VKRADVPNFSGLGKVQPCQPAHNLIHLVSGEINELAVSQNDDIPLVHHNSRGTCIFENNPVTILRLPKLFLGQAPNLIFFHQSFIGKAKFFGPIRHQGFQILVDFGQLELGPT
jgi:hypothetical protein